MLYNWRIIALVFLMLAWVAKPWSSEVVEAKAISQSDTKVAYLQQEQQEPSVPWLEESPGPNAPGSQGDDGVHLLLLNSVAYSAIYKLRGEQTLARLCFTSPLDLWRKVLPNGP